MTAITAQLPTPNSQLPTPKVLDVGTKPGVSVECVEDAWGFTSLRARWNELLHASDSDTPFLTWEWLHTWWAHLRGSSALRLIVVRSGDEVIAIAPLRLVSGPLPFLSRLEFLGTGDAGSDYLDLIVRRGRESEGLQAIAGYITSRGLAVRFNHLRPSSLAAQLAAQLAGDGWASATADDGTCPVIPLAGHTFDSYLGTLGSSHRANVRRRIKALGQQFEMGFDLITADTERRELLSAMAAFHDRRYDDRGGSSAFSLPAVRAFQEEVTRRGLDRGWLRMYALRLNGETAAVMYGINYGGRFYFYQHGFDDRYQVHSVGLVLMGLSVRAALDEGAREFDMLWGVEPYKFLWARDARILQRIELFPMHLGGTIHRHAIGARRRVGTLARRVLSIGESLGS
jgi:CelD/BcsL family acetyltransferase involved in cellulose biosynthesis